MKFQKQCPPASEMYSHCRVKSLWSDWFLLRTRKTKSKYDMKCWRLGGHQVHPCLQDIPLKCRFSEQQSHLIHHKRCQRIERHHPPFQSLPPKVRRSKHLPAELRASRQVIDLESLRSQHPTLQRCSHKNTPISRYQYDPCFRAWRRRRTYHAIGTRHHPTGRVPRPGRCDVAPAFACIKLSMFLLRWMADFAC